MTPARQFNACLAPVYNRGRPTSAMLNEMIGWAMTAPHEIFARNMVPVEIYTVIKSSLATVTGHDPTGTPIYAWDSLLHRKAALLETMRVHAMFESSGNWNEGVDRTNATSMANLRGQETGIFQVSFDSTFLADHAMKLFALAHGIGTPQKFIPAMKSDHHLALEYYARLARISIQWAGPLLRHGENSIYPWLRRDAVAEFQSFLK